MSYAEGIKGENYFASVMNQNGINYKFVDEWYDFEVKGHKVEVKTCKLTISNGHPHIGMYEFTGKDNRERQYNANIWVCLIIAHEGQFIIQGFIKARQLEKKQHISILKASKLKLKNLEQFINYINK